MVTPEELRRHAGIIARSDDPDTATALRWAAAEIDRLRVKAAVMREALEQIESILVRGDKSASYMLMKVRDALGSMEE